MYVVTCADKSFYCGITTDLDRRIDEHNTKKKGAKYTKSRRPVTLFFTQELPTRSAALKAEAAFKKLKRHDKLQYMASICEERLFAEYRQLKEKSAVDIQGDGTMSKHNAHVKPD
jgi:putative endonuclease